MSEQERKQEQKSPAKPEIKKDSGALDDKDVEKVTGGMRKAGGDASTTGKGF